MAWWLRRDNGQNDRKQLERAAPMIARAPLFEALERRELLAGDLPSIALIEADNRGLVLLTATADLNASTVNNSSVRVLTAGADQIFGTGDDSQVSRVVSYDAATRRIRIEATVGANTRYQVRLDASVIRGADGRQLDGEFRGASTVSGDGVQGGDLLFFSRRAVQDVVRFTTIAGLIDVDFFRDRAPLTVQNFLNYANRGVWDTTMINRLVSNFVAQGGGFFSTPPFGRIPQDPPVQNEFGVSNTRGTIAMAKQPGNPNSATTEWFFNLSDNSSNLDNQNGGFTAFGRVRNAASFAVLDAIGQFQTVDASSVNGAFSELPVVDRAAVQARNPLTIVSEDLVRITRIALLVDISGEPSQQIDSSGSVTFTSDDGATVQVFDMDQAGLGDLSNSVVVRFGRNNRISSITLRDPLPAARIGIAVTNASSVGSITDLRRAGSGNIAFIVSNAPVGSISLRSAITGENLNDFVLPGMAFDTDIDGDGSISDPLAIFVPSGFVTSFTAPSVNGDVVMRGGLGSATVLGDVTNADFILEGGGADTASTFRFGRVRDSGLITDGPIRTITAIEWLDSGGIPETIFARSLDSLQITGDRRAGVAGNFEAGLELSPAGLTTPALGRVSIAGDVFGSNWVVRGAIGAIQISGDASSWSIGNTTTIQSIRAGRLANTTISTSGRVGAVTVEEWQGGQLTTPLATTINITGDARNGVAGDFAANLTVNGGGTLPVLRTMNITGSMTNSTVNITGPVTSWTVRGPVTGSNIRTTIGDFRTMTLGEVRSTTINIQRTLLTLTATSFDGVIIQGGTYSTITTRGDTRTGNAGDAVNSDFRPAAAGTLSIRGDFGGLFNTRSVQTMTVGGDMNGGIVLFTQQANPNLRAADRIAIGGSMISSEIRTAGRVGDISMSAMIDSGIYVGPPQSQVGFPNDGSLLRPGAEINSIVVRGLGGSTPSYINSFIVATTINGASIMQPATDNFGRTFGIAVGTIGPQGIFTRFANSSQRLGPLSTTPAAVGDYQVRVNFVAPAVVVV